MHQNLTRRQAQQGQFIPPMSAQYGVRQPELQLEYFHDQGGIEGFGPLSFSNLQSQNLLGVGQGPGNTEPKYTAATATALAATGGRSGAFQFGQPVDNSAYGPNTSPDSGLSGRQGFNTGFNFTSPPGSAPSGVSESIPPHDPFRAEFQRSSQHGQDYLNSSEYVPHQKRRREDTGLGVFPPTDAVASADDDDEFSGQYSYSTVGDQYASYRGTFGQGETTSQSPNLLSQAGLGSIGQGTGFPLSSDQGAGQNPQGQQMGSDGKIKPVHRAACIRCKNLKVRCEFTTDPNTCRRCLNGGHECLIPGRKKRRQPPKREHLLNQIRDQAQKIEELSRQLEEHRRTRLNNEAPRLSLSNTPLVPPGSTPVAGRPSSSQVPGTGPRPDVQEWIERARESIQALGAFVEGEEDIEEQEDAEEDYDGDEDYVANLGGEHQWREPAAQNTDTDEGGVSVEGPDDDDQTDEQRSYREASPATTVTSREGSTPPHSASASGRRRGSRRRTPQPTRLAPLPETPAAPLKLIADLSIKAGSNRQGKQSPKSAALGPSSHSRSSSIEIDPTSASTADGSSPRLGGAMPEKGQISVHDTVVERQAEAAHESASDGEYGAVAPGYFEARKRGVSDASRLAPARHPVPHILMRGIVTPQEVEDLFKIYFDKMNLSCSLLDPVLYTAQYTYWRSPFLFTVICAVASRYYTSKPGLYDELITYAQLAAGTALISGPKNVETVSAYILLSLYPVPMKRWEEDRTWLYLGLAIRVATDLNLHQPSTAKPRNEQHERELLNRTRVWLNCCNLDISTTIWHGKSSTIPSRDYIACHSESWYESSQYSLPNFDIHLSGYNLELRLMRAFKEKIYSDPNNPTGLNKDVDFIRLSSETDEALVRKEREWNERLQQKTDPSDPQGRFRNSLLRLAYRYSRLTALSFGFQHSFGKDSQSNADQVSFFDRCYRAATDVVRVFIDELSTQKEYIRHGPEAQCVFVTFASAFLIKLLHPKYAAYLRLEQRKEIDRLIRGLIDLLGSLEVVVDDRHSPKLWSRFLEGLLATPMAKIELSPSAMKGGSPLPRRTPRRQGGHAGDSPSGKRGSPSLTPSSRGSPSPAAHTGSSSHAVSDTRGDSPASLFDGSVSTPPLVPPVSTLQDQHSASFSLNASNNQAQQGFQPLAHAHSQQEVYGPQNSLQIDIPEFFRPPLPFDYDLLQSMQSMPDSSLWQNMPGFNFMGNLQFDQDATMQDALAPSMGSYDMNAVHANATHY